MERIRCFIAVDIEDQEVIGNITRVQQALLPLGKCLKLVEKENIHLTLRFLGELPQTLVNDVIEILSHIDFTPFKIMLRGIGAFPRLSRPNVIWVGVEEGAEQLRDLASKINAALRKLRLPPPDKPFSPHITIARVKRRPDIKTLMNIMNAFSSDVYGSLLVDNFRLKKSTLTPKGPIYTVLLRVDLK
ncbi:MAG TPA: RNA 2',3'-cyclic phosphodiesterase [Thermoproteales archaeon]|nr:RNA 2',3'-cyclic phosphodiesterase [Thermoproteales archaeon]